MLSNKLEKIAEEVKSNLDMEEIEKFENALSKTIKPYYEIVNLIDNMKKQIKGKHKRGEDILKKIEQDLRSVNDGFNKFYLIIKK